MHQRLREWQEAMPHLQGMDERVCIQSRDRGEILSMRSSNSCLGSITLCLGVCCALGRASEAHSQDRFVSYTGRATDQVSGAFLYGETHILHYRDDRLAERLVTYTCKDGTVFARKSVDYVAATAPDFMLEDRSNGMREGVRGGRGADRTVFFRRTADDEERSGTLAASADLVIDAGFDEFIRAHWQTLLSGRSQPLDFVVPSRLTSMRFAVKHVRSAPADGVPSELFELKVSGIVGWIAPTIDVYYSAADRVLVAYDGVTDLRDRHGENYRAHITFPPRERQEASEWLAARARRAPLEPCK